MGLQMGVLIVKRTQGYDECPKGTSACSFEKNQIHNSPLGRDINEYLMHRGYLVHIGYIPPCM
jgi:hypothetical protein